MVSRCAVWLVNYPLDHWTVGHFKREPAGFVEPLHSEFAVGIGREGTDSVPTACQSCDTDWT